MGIHPKAEETIIIIEDYKSKKFKQFDIIADNHPRHRSNLSSSATSNHSETRELSSETISLIMKEWSILKDSLPDSIFVRAYEGTIDRLTAVIIGPPGTPYHNGLFFFDIQITPGYPYTRPKIEPFCPGHKSLDLETKEYTILEILVSQIANFSSSKPKPALDHSNGILPTYSEHLLDKDFSTFYKNCRMMLAILRAPPKHFEEFVAEHFRDCAESILIACKSYIFEAESKIFEDVVYNGNHCVQIDADSTTGAIKKGSERHQKSMKSTYYKLFKAFTRNGSTNSLENIYNIGEISMDDIEGMEPCSSCLLFHFVIFLAGVLLISMGFIFTTDATYHDKYAEMLPPFLGLSFCCGLAYLLLKITRLDFPLFGGE